MKFSLLRYLSVLFSVCVFSSGAGAVDYPGVGVGAIPDNNPAGINITFDAATFNQQVGGVSLRLGINHTYVADLKIKLTSPSGVSSLVIFSRVGRRSTGGGGSSNLAGVYTFSDLGADFWATAAPLASASNIPPGAYRTSTGGVDLVGGGTNDHGGCFTSLAGAFLGLNPVDASGTWTLNIADVVSGDIGTASSAVLSLTPVPDSISRNGFEIASRGTCKSASFDFTGTGRSDYVTLRNTGGGPSGAVTWFVKSNDGTPGGGAETSFLHGIATDFFVSGDWDGDGISDAAIWRPGAPGLYILRLSTRPSRPFALPFGLTGDDPKIVDDFNGDGITDFAIYRAGATTGAVSHTLIKLSSTFVDRDFITGENGAFPCSGDYNGDGAADIGVQNNAGGGVASFRLFDGLAGGQFATFALGTPTDVIVDGNFTGDFVDDMTVIRGVGGVIQWTSRNGSTGVTQATVPFGNSATDFVLTGDYDGDGLDDYSTWRPSTTPGQSKFTLRLSTAPATPIDVFFGANGDYPVANFRTH